MLAPTAVTDARKLSDIGFVTCGRFSIGLPGRRILLLALLSPGVWLRLCCSVGRTLSRWPKPPSAPPDLVHCRSNRARAPGPASGEPPHKVAGPDLNIAIHLIRLRCTITCSKKLYHHATLH